MNEFINLTPHAITIIKNDGTTMTIEPSGAVARVAVDSYQLRSILGVKITKNEYHEVTGLPEPKEGRYYIVSVMVAQRVPGRNDVLVTNEAVRDDKGRIIGCRSLARV